MFSQIDSGTNLSRFFSLNELLNGSAKEQKLRPKLWEPAISSASNLPGLACVSDQKAGCPIQVHQNAFNEVSTKWWRCFRTTKASKIAKFDVAKE